MNKASNNPAFSINYQALGSRLRAYRVGASLQATEIARKLGVSRAVVYRMEKGEIIKIDTLERIANLLGTSLASLLGVEVEYYSSVLSFMERMRQLELTAERVVAHFDPISLLLASDYYLGYLKQMLLEAAVHATPSADTTGELERIFEILRERREFFRKRRPQIISLVGLREIERFVQTGLVGRLNLPLALRQERIEAARQEVLRVADLMESEPIGIQIGVVDDAMPAISFQVFSNATLSMLAVSPFRFGELPNVRHGIATVTASPEALYKYEALIECLWKTAYKGRCGAQQLRNVLERNGVAV